MSGAIHLQIHLVASHHHITFNLLQHNYTTLLHVAAAQLMCICPCG
jgi:hypothetical protein